MTKTTRKRRQKVSNLLDPVRWAGYAAAGTAALVATHEADAGIHYFSPINKYLDGSTAVGYAYPNSNINYASHKIDVNNDGIGDLNLAHFGSIYYGTFKWGVAQVLSNLQTNAVPVSVAGFLVTAPPVAGVNFYNYLDNFAKGQLIDGNFLPGGSMAVELKANYPNGKFHSPGDGQYIGFKFNAGAGSQYGWVQVDMVGEAHNAFTILDYAWADPGETIHAGDGQPVPEPGSLGLLATGALGLMLWRWKRKRSSEAA